MKPGLLQFKKASQIANQLDITCWIGYSGKASEADMDERAIYIDLNEAITIQQFWSLFFHELAHVWCYDHDKYYIYHNDALPHKQLGDYIRRMGLRIERYVDKVGKKLMKQYFPRMRYLPAYKSKTDVQFYKDWVKTNYPL